MTSKATSWADETDDYLEQETTQQKPVGNAWSKGNPLTTAEKDSREGSREPEERPSRREYNDDYERRDDYNRSERRDDRDYSYERRDNDSYRGGYRGGRGGSRGGMRSREQREPREPREPRPPVPFPEQAPYTAFVGNLPYEVTKEELSDWFTARKCAVVGVRLLTTRDTNRSKGYGYVEFSDADSLRTALESNNETIHDRALRVDIAESKQQDQSPSDRPYRREGSSSSYRGGRGGRRGGENENGSSSSSSSTGEEGSQAKERPKIEIKPRSVPLESGAEASYKGAKSNPFGEAKPRDESLFQKKKDEERKSREPEDKSQESQSVEETSSSSSDRKPQQKSRYEDRPPRDSSSRGGSSRGGSRGGRGGRGGSRGGRFEETGGKFKRDERAVKDFARQAMKKDEHSAPVNSKNIFSALEEEEAE